jgi:hypothetical protein
MPDGKASHSSLGKKFGSGVEKLQIPKYLSYDLYSAVIPSFSGNSGEERMKSGYRNRLLEKELPYRMHIATNSHSCRSVVTLCLLMLTRTNNFPVGKIPPKTFVLKDKHIPPDLKK